MGGIASIFTPQNTYSASAPVNNGGQDMTGLLAGTQANTATNVANQSSLANQLLAQSQGAGPNPAQQMLNNATTQNQQLAAGQEASQKGINPGLAQKQIANTSANLAQQGAGQGALMGAQQQLSAQGQLSGLYNNMANQNLANQGQYENSLNAQNTTNAGVAAQNTAANQNTTSGLLNGAGSALAALYSGGEVKKYSGGGNVLGADIGQPDNSPAISLGLDDFPSSSGPEWGTGLSSGMGRLDTPADLTPNTGANAAGAFLQGAGSGGTGSASQAIADQMAAAGGVPHWAAGNASKNSSGVNPGQMAQMAAMFAAHGGMVPTTSPLHPVMQLLKARGGAVPGQAPVAGDSPQNDIVPAVLSPKEIVLPRSVAMAPDAGDKAKSFVEQIKGQHKKGESGYAKVLAAKRKAK